MEGWVGLGLVTYWNRCPAPGTEPDTVTHLSTNRAQRRLTALIKANVLTTAPDHQYKYISLNNMMMMESPVGTTYELQSLYFLWILMWPTRPILTVNCRPQSSQVNGLVSVDLAAGTDWLVEPFRRLRFSTAVAMRTSSKCCTPVRQAFRHLDLLPAMSWITYYST